nr:reverse transcriptase domain-containing protein [Tanacetum cinerariifolium]
VDFDVDPRVPLILGRSFLKTGRALIDVYAGELTLRVNNEAVTFNLDQTSRYSANYNDMTANRIDVIDMACEEYSQEVLDFSDVIASGNPTPYYEPIVSTSFSTLTPFRDSDFLLEEVDAFLALEDDPTSPEVDHSYYDMEGDIVLLEAFLNDDPSLPPPTQGMYLPQIRKELKICEAKNDKSSIDKPPEVELKGLPPHLKYAFMEGDDKLPVIIDKDLSVEEKSALIKVLKLHKRAIAWKLFDIKGINPEFCTHKILMEDDFKPVVQHQRRVNPKIHDVMKKEVEILLDARLIYPISDSPWVTFKFPSILKIKKRPHSCVLIERFPTAACLSGCVMHRACSKDTKLCLNWEKSHFMVKEGIVLGHKISKNGIEVDKAKFDVIVKLPHPTTVKVCEIFDVWGIDFMGSFPSSRGDKYILVAVDYLSKWVEAKALPTNDARVVGKFLKSLFARFGTLRAIISDRGTHFCNDQFPKVMLKYDFNHRLATAYHPQTSGKVEVFNRGLKRILERNVGENSASWSDKLDDTLWAFLQLNELNELRDQAYENSLIYKEKTKRIHDSKFKDRVFNVGDQVLLFNSRLRIFSGKLKTAGLDHSLSPKCFLVVLSSYPKPTGQTSRFLRTTTFLPLRHVYYSFYLCYSLSLYPFTERYAQPYFFSCLIRQSNGSQIKFEDINQIDEDDMEEIDIKWNMALLSMRADKFWKRTGKKISI